MFLFLKKVSKKNFNFTLNCNIYFLLFIINFLAYSVYAVLSRYNIFLIEIIINLNFIIFYYLYKNYDNKKIFYISINYLELIFFTCLAFILILLIYNELNLPIFIDEIAFSRRSTRTALFTSVLILKYLDIESLKLIPIKHVIHLLNFLQLFTIFFIFYIIGKKKSYFYLSLILIINFLLRYLLKDAIHHPPLNHLFSTSFISIFGLNHIVFRLSYFVPFIFFLFFLYKLINKIIDKKPSIIFIVSLSTFPLLLLSSVIPDHSFWGSLIFIYILFYISIYEKINYELILIMISIGVLFRISVFTAFVLIAACFIFDIFNKRFYFFDKIKQLIIKEKIQFIILVCLPLLFVSLGGTPATIGLGQNNIIENFYEAINSKIILYAFIKQVPPWYYFFIFCVILSLRKFEIFVFFIFNLFIYFSVMKDLWGLAKYTLEYAIPFVLIGHFLFTKYLISKSKFLLINSINILIIILNVHNLYNFPKTNISYDTINENGFFKSVNNDYNKNTKYVTNIPYKYTEAFDYISTINKREKTLLLATHYGFLPQIIENYNFNQLAALINLRSEYELKTKNKKNSSSKFSKILSSDNLYQDYKNYSEITNDKIVKYNNTKNKNKKKQNSKEFIKNINSIENLEYILLGNYNHQGSRKDFVELLISNNWKIKKKFVEKHYRTTLILLEKN